MGFFPCDSTGGRFKSASSLCGNWFDDADRKLSCTSTNRSSWANCGVCFDHTDRIPYCKRDCWSQFLLPFLIFCDLGLSCRGSGSEVTFFPKKKWRQSGQWIMGTDLAYQDVSKIVKNIRVHETSWLFPPLYIAEVCLHLTLFKHIICGLLDHTWHVFLS